MHGHLAVVPARRQPAQHAQSAAFGCTSAAGVVALSVSATAASLRLSAWRRHHACSVDVGAGRAAPPSALRSSAARSEATRASAARVGSAAVAPRPAAVRAPSASGVRRDQLRARSVSRVSSARSSELALFSRFPRSRGFTASPAPRTRTTSTPPRARALRRHRLPPACPPGVAANAFSRCATCFYRPQRRPAPARPLALQRGRRVVSLPRAGSGRSAVRSACARPRHQKRGP